MRGKINIVISSGNEKFRVELTRKVTVLRGNSGIGKSVFYDMIRTYYSGLSVGISKDIKLELHGCKDIIIPYDSGDEWEDKINSSDNSVVLIDESNTNVLKSGHIGSVIKNSGNYFLIISRKYTWMDEEDVDAFSDDEKDVNISHSTYGEITFDSYVDENGICVNYSVPIYRSAVENIKPDLVIVEDARSGYQFFKETLVCDVISARSKTRVVDMLKAKVDSGIYKNIYVVVDGENFGYEANILFQYLDSVGFKISGVRVVVSDIRSFEWLLLSTGKVFNKNISNVLTKTEDFCEAKLYNSWEKFYTRLIEDGRIRIFSKGGVRNIWVADRNECVYTKKVLAKEFLDRGLVKEVYKNLYDIDSSAIRKEYL